MEDSLFNSFMNGPDENGRFGQFGGRFVSETLMPLILELEAEYEKAKKDKAFCAEMDDLWEHYVGRPSPLYFAERLTKYLNGAKVYMKPASQGTGVIAGGGVRAVLETLGVQDVLSKSQGSSNPHNVVKATFDALLRLRNANTVASERGITLEKVFNG